MRETLTVTHTRTLDQKGHTKDTSLREVPRLYLGGRKVVNSIMLRHPGPANPKRKTNTIILLLLLSSLACAAMRTATPHPMYPKVPILLLLLILGLCADGDSHPPSRVPSNAATLVSSVGLSGSNATSQRGEEGFLSLNPSTPFPKFPTHWWSGS